MVNEPARESLLWAVLSLVLPVTFGHTTACRSPAPTYSAGIEFSIKRSTPCSAVSRHPPSYWATVVHQSAFIPQALRSSRKHHIHYFSWPPRTPRTPPVLQTLRPSAVSCPLYAPQIPEEDPPPAYNCLDVLTSRLYKPVHGPCNTVS